MTPPLQASSSKNCNACRIRCLPCFISKRFDLLLSSLSLCLRFGSLTQFPPTLDLYRFAIACRGGFAGARRSTHYQDDMHCQMIRLHQNKMSRAAADDRSRGKSSSNSKRGNAALWAVQSASIAALRAAHLQCESLSLGGQRGIFSFRGKRISPLTAPLHGAGKNQLLTAPVRTVRYFLLQQKPF